MSNLIVPDDGKAAQIKRLVNLSGNLPTHLLLIMADFFPSHTTVNADLQEATFSGYSRGTFVNPVMSFDPATFRYVVTWNPKTWTKNGPVGNFIHGYSVRDIEESLWWVEKFDAPISLSADGSFLTLTPRLTLASQFSNGP